MTRPGATLNLSQQLRLQHRLSPQQIQLVKLLQLPAIALEQRIEEELEANPVLELEAASERMADADEPLTQDDEYNWEELLGGGDDLYGYKARVDKSEPAPEYPPLAAPVSLAEHLRSQCMLLQLDDAEALVAEQIIGSIEEDGYLRRPLASIADDIAFNQGRDVAVDDVELVLQRIQRLDPPGIAARNLQECLAIQVDVMSDSVCGRDTAALILEQAFEDFAMRRFNRLIENLDAKPKELKQAIEIIHGLNPKPGEGSISTHENYITPDFMVRYEAGTFHVALSSRNSPPLRVSSVYRKMMEELAATDRAERSKVDEHTRQFLKSKVTAAQWFIESIDQRRRTMLSVMETIVERQSTFFRSGEGHLRPLILKDVAEHTGLDISTVSRVASGKYVQTDFGVYPLKYFFSEGLHTTSGDYVSNREVKAVILGLIGTEDKATPLSDQKLTEHLHAKGYKVSRRTVTKYRKQLNLPAARMRRQFVLD